MKKIALVSGGNRGIGLEICRQLNRAGFIVVFGSRDLEKGKLVSLNFSENLIVLKLDVTKSDTIEDVFTYIETKFGRLDVLINNAGIGESFDIENKSFVQKTKNAVEKRSGFVRNVNKKIVPILRKSGIIANKTGASDVSIEKVKKIMDTNLYGSWRMIQKAIPMLEKSDNPQIINVSSGTGELHSLTGELPAYSLSKNSLNALTIMFANELKIKNISVNAVCPGWVKTDMGGHNATRSVEKGAETIVWLAIENNTETGKFFRDKQEINW